ncbi:hypothetical protein BH10PSE13_BH10PSE13_03900 [soil metagenome]
MQRGMTAGWGLASAGLLLGGLSCWAQGPLPGDVPVTRAVQALLGVNPLWANIVTKTATAPWMWLMTALVALVLGWLRGGRMALTVVLSFAVAVALDGLLRHFIHVPRPLADLIAVAKPSPSSGLPSTFGLVGGATMGLVALIDRRGAGRFVAVLGWAYLLAGFAARVTMGGHWASQLLASYAVALGFAMLLRGIVARA